MKIPRWSRLFILITFRFITFGTLFGIVTFPLIGLIIKTGHSPQQLAWIGAQTLGLCSSLIGPVAALILTARKITAAAAAGEITSSEPDEAPSPPKSENQPDR